MSLTVALRLAFQGKEAQTGVRATATEVKGLTAATREAGAASAAAAGQQRQMTGALAETEAAARSAATAQVTAAQAGRDLAQSQHLAAGSVGNLTANLNDVAMMIMAGQNPLQLAIQQGTQITQVIGPMGAVGAVGALKAAFLQLLNPVNLGTLAIIALGAAAIQWLTSAGDKAMSFADAVDELKAKVDAYKAASEKAGASTADLRKEFGANAEAAREYYRELAEIEKREAERAARAAAAAVRDAVAPTGLQGAYTNASQTFNLDMDLESSVQLVDRLLYALGEVERAKGVEEQVRWLEELRSAIDAAATADGIYTTEEDAALRNVNLLLAEKARLVGDVTAAEANGRFATAAQFLDYQAQLAAARAEDAALAQQMLSDLSSEAQIRQLITQHGQESAIVAAARANAEREVYAAMVDSMNISAALKDELMRAYDAAKGIASVNIAGMLEAAIGKAAALANNLWNAANASSAIRPMMNVGSNLGAGLKGWATGLWNNMVTMATSGTGGGVGAGVASGSGVGGGGGASAAQAESDAVAELIQRKERELELLRETDPVQKEMLRYREQLAGATDAERRQVEQLIATRQREEQGIKARADAVAYANDRTLNLLNTVIVQGKSANAVLQQLLGSLAQAFITGKGPLAGVLGIKGGLFDMVFPKAAAPAAMVGRAAPAMAMAAAKATKPVMNVYVTGATGNQEVRSMVAQGVQAGLRAFSTDVLPKEIRQANADPQVLRK